MVNVSTNDSKISINVSSAGTKGVVQAQNDKSKYYEELAHEHELNAKASELLAKDWANKLGDTVDGVEYSAKHYAEEAEATLTEVESAKVQAIADIQEQEGSSISALNVEKGSILIDLSNAKGEILGDITEEGVAQVNIVTGTGATAISEVNTTKDRALNNISGALSSSLNSIDTAKVNAISDVVAESNTQKQQLQTYVNKASEYADNAKVSETNAHNSEIYCKEVIERIGTAIKIKGRVDLFENLPKTGNLDGDAYLVGLEGLESYPEYYWYQNHWEFLGTSGGGGNWGTITGDITAQTDLQNALGDKVSFTDYATTNTAGVIKTYNNYSTAVDDRNGILYCQTKSATSYNGLSANTFIGKGTLENIKEDFVTSVGDTKYQDKLTVGNGIDITNNKISTNTQFNITEDMFDIEYDDTKGVAPYSTSYGYTNVTIKDNAGVEWVDGASYTFVIDTKQSSSTYRNLRFRIGESGDWKPAMLASGVISGNSVFVKSVNCIFFYKTTYQANGALHVLVDTNTTYTLNYTVDAGQYKAGGNEAYSVARYSILGQLPDCTWQKIINPTVNNTTKTSKTVNTKGFLLNKLAYYNTSTTVKGGDLIGSNTLYRKSTSVQGVYNFNCGSAPNWEIGDYIYLVGTVKEDGLFYLDTTKWWDNALPTTNDGKLYIQLGLALTTTDSTFSLLQERPILYHDGTGIREYIPHDNTKQDVISDLDTIRDGASKGATALQSVPSNYVTDTQLATKQDKLVAGSGIGIDNQEISVKVFDKSKFTVVGSPTITDDGIASDFSNGNCVILSSQITQSANSWEIKIPFSYEGTLRKDRWLISGNDYNSNSYIRILSSDKLNYTFLKENRSNLFQITGTNTLEYNTKYITTAIFTGTEYNFYLTNLETGTTNLDATFSSTEKVVDFNTCALGCRSVNRAYDVPFTDGSVDLAQFSTKVNGIEVFNGTKTIYQALDDFVKTSNLSEINPMIISVVDGSSGYNIWANGYGEQWGNTNFSSSGTTVNLIKQMLNTNYMIVYEYVGGSSSSYGEGISVHGKTTSSFTAHGYHSTGLSNVNINWKISGYLAEGEY